MQRLQKKKNKSLWLRSIRRINMKQEKDYFLLTLDETEEIAKEVIRLAKNVKVMHMANPDNPDIVEKASELQRKAEKLTLRARVMVMYSQAPDGKALSFKNTENVIPVELAISEDGWFCMRLPMLASKKMKGNSDYIREFLYDVLTEYFNTFQFKKLNKAALIFKHVYKHGTPESWYRDHDNIETKQVADVVALFTMVDDSPKHCFHLSEGSEGDDNLTEIYVVPDKSFMSWIMLERKLRGKQSMFDYIIEKR